MEPWAHVQMAAATLQPQLVTERTITTMKYLLSESVNTLSTVKRNLNEDNAKQQLNHNHNPNDNYHNSYNENNDTMAIIANIRSNVTRILYTHLRQPIEALTNNYNNNSAALSPHHGPTDGAAQLGPSTSATTTTYSTIATVRSQDVPNAITFPMYSMPVHNLENCSDIFTNFTVPEEGSFCSWVWDKFLCWPPTPAGVLARMHCPAGWRAIDTRKYANRKCELDGSWGARPNETHSVAGWTDYQPCFKPEVSELLQKMKNPDLFVDIAKRTRTLEIVGLVLSLLALLVSLIIFFNFRTLRNNRTKIHKNLFIAMILQVLVRLTLYLDQAFRRGKPESAKYATITGIENTPLLCEASYVLLEYAKTAMFMWMFIEGLYLHNMVTVAVFQGRFPHAIFFIIGWGVPIIITTIWAICTSIFMDTGGDCWWNYNLTPYYWILEGPRLVVIVLNFFFLINIIRVLVVKLRQSQASEVEQTRKAVRAAIVLLPLLGITNLLHLVPALDTPWKFALWSYVTHFLTSFQGFFIALIYCFLNGEVRAVLLKSVTVYMSVRGHTEWTAPKRASVFSGGYNTAPDTEVNGQRDSTRLSTKTENTKVDATPTAAATALLSANSSETATPPTALKRNYLRYNSNAGRHHWLATCCYRGQQNKRVMAGDRTLFARAIAKTEITNQLNELATDYPLELFVFNCAAI